MPRCASPHALAALGVVLPVTLIIRAFANLIGLGGAPRAGIKMGEKKNRCGGGIQYRLFPARTYRCRPRSGAFNFAREIILIFGCPESAVEYAFSYLKIYSCGSVFVMLSQGLNPFILTQGYSALGQALRPAAHRNAKGYHTHPAVLYPDGQVRLPRGLHVGGNSRPGRVAYHIGHYIHLISPHFSQACNADPSGKRRSAYLIT